MKKWSLLLSILLPLSSWGASELAQTVTLDGQLFQDSSGTDPLLDSHARLRIQILNGDKSCVLYEEQQFVDTTASKGLFSIQLGSSVGDGKRVAGNDPGNTMVAVYQNTTSIPATGCAGNSSPAVAYAKRYIRMHLLRTGGVEEALNPEIELGSMPMASVAQTLQGYSAAQFLILGSGDLTQANMQSLFISGNVAKLTSIIGNYGTNGTVQIPTTGAAPGSPQAGQVWYDSVANKLKYFDGTTTRTLGIESGSTVSNVTATAPLSSTGGTTPDISISKATTSTDGYLSSTDWNTFKTGADAATGATSANTTSKIVTRDASGNFAAGTITANLTGAASLNVLKAGDTLTGSLTFPANRGNVFTAGSGAGTVMMQGPMTAIGTNYVLRLPDAQGGANQVLMNDGSGNLSWVDPLSGVPGVMAIAKGGTNSSTALNNHRIMVSKSGAIVEGDALANGQFLIGSAGADPVAANLTAGSGIQITNGAGSVTIATTGTQSSTLSTGKIWVGNGSNVATEVTPSQDISVSTAGVMQVNRIQNNLVSGAPVTGGILSWDTTTSMWKGKAFPACSTSQTPYYNSTSDAIECQAIATSVTTVSGTLPVANGGTNSATALSNHRIMVSQGGAIVEGAALTNGQILIGSTGTDPVAANLTAGSGIQITNAAGGVTIATTGTQSSTLSAGKIWVGNGSNVATEVTPSQDISVSTAGVMQVNRIQNSLVSGTGLTAGLLSWDSATSTWKGKAFPACSTSETPYYNSSTDSIGCQAIAVSSAAMTGTLAATSGGTGQSSYTIGDLLYASSTTALSRLPAGTNGYVLTSAGPGTAPSWTALPSSVTGSGTAGTYAKFTASGTVGDALLSETGSTVNVAGAIQTTGPIVSVPTSGALTSFDFSTGGNIKYTSSACQAMTLSGMADGGSYTVAVQNNTGTCSFTHAGLTVKLAGAAASVTISTQTVFTFIRAGSFVYGTWVTF